MSNRKLINYFVITLISTLSFGCKKIPMPNEESKLIFGKWKCLGESGVLGGNLFKTKNRVEFTEKGVFRLWEDSILKRRTSFKVYMEGNYSTPTIDIKKILSYYAIS